MPKSLNVKRYASTQRYIEREAQLQRIYDFIVAFFEDEGFSPSLMEIAEAVYMSRSNVVRYLDLLEARGFLTRVPRTPRTIKLTMEEEEM